MFAAALRTADPVGMISGLRRRMDTGVQSRYCLLDSIVVGVSTGIIFSLGGPINKRSFHVQRLVACNLPWPRTRWFEYVVFVVAVPHPPPPPPPPSPNLFSILTLLLVLLLLLLLLLVLLLRLLLRLCSYSFEYESNLIEQMTTVYLKRVKIVTTEPNSTRLKEPHPPFFVIFFFFFFFFESAGGYRHFLFKFFFYQMVEYCVRD